MKYNLKSIISLLTATTFLSLSAVPVFSNASLAQSEEFTICTEDGISSGYYDVTITDHNTHFIGAWGGPCNININVYFVGSATITYYSNGCYRGGYTFSSGAPTQIISIPNETYSFYVQAYASDTNPAIVRVFVS